MKKLTKSKRDTVRFLLKRAMNDLKVAKDITFKAYGSHDITLNLSFVLWHLEDAFKHLNKTKLPKEEAKGLECPAKGKECPMQQQAMQPVKEDDLEKRFKECVCDQLSVKPEQCVPQAKFVEDFGADDLDPIELAMALEVEFGICFADAEVEGFSTYGNLLNLVKEKLDAKAKDTKGDGNTEPKAKS